MSTVLCVGQLNAWQDVLRSAETRGDVHFVSFSEVSPSLVTDLAPETVISPLLTDEFDATDLAASLQASGFTGRYISVAVGIPVPQMIEREVRIAAPSITFDLVLIDGSIRLN